ncbi:MAG: aspartate--tRNA ligase [Candidatus Sungbacteria bacterium]|uniref:Aspartate--tRNA(Asp/Asn) ligase n=1 Tax=Candidatus Sungiibacteriota bacterium TaxID=2750080 RepID=A0A932YVM3_9BACT|nr:aspartate--tRNA ligase [Candidatus Sungbacteria bacterium]
MERMLTAETPKNIGKRVLAAGWVSVRRDHGKLIFIDLRDAGGVLQLVFRPDNEALYTEAERLRPEWVIAVEGTLRERPKGMENADLPTGGIEMPVEKLEVLNEAETPPFPLDTPGLDIEEELRLQYRYLDLRRPRLQKNMSLRHQAVQFIRQHLSERRFIEIETPVLTKTTPEGARDFLVPSRLQPGKFYALPQSPQQYKQLLMVAGFERYFQIARCFRDEDPRADRAYGEFTQLDLEMSFVSQEDILRLAEELFTNLAAEIFREKRISQTPWLRLSHQEAIQTYGTDKPDLRRDKNDPNELAFAWVLDFPLFKEQEAGDFFHGSGTSAFAPSHHMFTAPHPDDAALLDTDPTRVRGLQHDMVLNGFEVGGGSIRIHRADVQEKIFGLIGFSQEQKRQFAHMLKAFSYGVPPHGGIAPGIDRFLMAALGEPSVREMIAFPASSGGKTAVMDAPSDANPKQLAELGLDVKTQKP